MIEFHVNTLDIYLCRAEAVKIFRAAIIRDEKCACVAEVPVYNNFKARKTRLFVVSMSLLAHHSACVVFIFISGADTRADFKRTRENV